MSTLADFQVTDDVTDNLEVKHNRFLGMGFRAEFTNTETITDTKELQDGDCQYQIITASGANRIVKLAPEGDDNHLTVIFNTGATYSVIVEDDGGTIVYSILAPNEWGVFIPFKGEGWMTENKSAINNKTCDGRLTLETGVPVSTSDQTAKTTVYFTPYTGNKISLYNGTYWIERSFSEISVAVPATTNTPFDIFCYDNSGVPALETVNWTNDTTRATALTLQDGVLVKNGALTRRYLGTGRTTGSSGQCEDSKGGVTSQVGGKRFLWNYYNRVRRSLAVIDKTDTWSYTTGTWRQANNNTGNKVEFVVGVTEDDIIGSLVAVATLVSNSARGAYVGFGIDVTNSPSGTRGAGYNAAASLLITSFGCNLSYTPAIGYHYIAWLEYGGDGTCTFDGDGGATEMQSGMNISVIG